jgi:type 1 glutamine amidotransferase
LVRRRILPKEQLDRIRAYLDAGKGLVALRTCSHAFHPDPPAPSPPGYDQWPEFDHDVLGGNYDSYVKKPGTFTIMRVAPDAANHPIVAGIAPPEWRTDQPMYYVAPLAKNAKVIVIGKAGDETDAVAWVHPYKNARVFYAASGGVKEFEDIPQFQKLVLNAIFWAMDRPAPAAP